LYGDGKKNADENRSEQNKDGEKWLNLINFTNTNISDFCVFSFFTFMKSNFLYAFKTFWKHKTDCR
jgi:hypothetical protein